MKKILYLASKSPSRHKLLKDSGIDFKVIEQTADEESISWQLPLEVTVKSIADLKMKHVILPAAKFENEICFVLTADTLGINSLNEICGKPKSKQDAIDKIKSYRNGAQTGTAFCLEKRVWKNSNWLTEKKVLEFVSANYIFDVPDHFIERYFELSLAAGIDYMQVSGAVAIEEFGAQFLKTVNGSYTTIIGLPLYELRIALDQIGFFNI